MNLEAVEDCLHRAAEQSSVWAVIREAAEATWVIVLADESIVDVAYDEAHAELLFRAELGLVNDAMQRSAINDLILRCNGVIPVPTITLTQDQRYELLATWLIEPDAPQPLGAYLDDMASQVSLWREVVNQPMAAGARASTVTEMGLFA
jgi:hypothetical protein